ncbi:unnamed protein product [Hymenolepis diminuta]|uniref:N-acetyltransferase domain-containing protein n=1 Tax=Hymenolepis diminuta TaxID=6216 RepID=A0A158QC80_HYMDI|nr:unnamed protein product [Hymenolepis diminuta]
MGLVSPMECRNHFLSIYASGILANFYHPEPPIPERDFNECPGELCLTKTPIPRECCKKLGLKPKRDDFEYDYDNDAELPITRIRVDFLGDEHYRGLGLALIDMYEERLRRRRLHHVLLANLNLLTHLLPRLFPEHYVSAAKATAGTGYHGSGQARAVLDQSRRSDSAPVRKRLLVNQRRRRHQFFGRGFLAATRMKSSLEHQHLEDSTPKNQQPPSSVESMQDSGVGYSESPLHSVLSVENSNGVTNSSPVGDVAAGEGTPIKSGSTPILETDACHHLTANMSRKVATSRTTSMTNKKPKNWPIVDPPSTQLTNNCCIPPCVADPLKPLLRFLSASEADTLLNQLHSTSLVSHLCHSNFGFSPSHLSSLPLLHRAFFIAGEHILRQEIEQLQQLKRSQNVFLNETRLAGSMTSPSRFDHSEEDSSDEEQRRKADKKFSFHGSIPSFNHLRRRRSHSLFTHVKRGAKRHIETAAPPKVNHRIGLRSGRVTNLASNSSRGRSRGTRRRGRPPLHHHGSRHHHRLLIRA